MRHLDSGFGTINVKRTEDLFTWDILALAPYGCKSLAIMNDRLYLGMENAEIMEYSSPISELNTSIHLEEENGIIIYPNPCLDEINIIMPSEREMTGTLYDYSGRTVWIQKFIDRVNSLEISFLPSGLYLIRLENDNSIEVRVFKN